MERHKRDLRAFYLIPLSKNSAACARPPSSAGSGEPQIGSHGDPQQDPRELVGYTALGIESGDADAPDEGLGSPKHDQEPDFPPQHEASPLGEPRDSSHSHQRAVTTKVNIDSESDLNRTRGKALQLKGLIRDELSTLRNIQLAWKDSACQRCRLLGLACDRARPSCFICEHNFLQCHYKHDEAIRAQEEYYQPQEIPVGPELEPIPWLGSFKDNPYHSLEGNQKKSRPEARFPKPRPPKLRLYQKRFHTADAAKDDEKPLLETSPTVSEGGVHPSGVESAVPIASPPDSPPSSPLHPPSRTNPLNGSGRIIPLVFASSPPVVSFQCTFCLKLCKDWEEWEQHEYSQHIPQEEWICMPWGPIEESGGRNTCVFCDATDIDTEHCSMHADQPCYNQDAKDRTYISKDDFREHLRTVHNQPAMTNIMQGWSWPPEDNAWYWNCGFCGEVLARWPDRARHIGNHFQEGEVMSSWDPLMPSYPLDKTTLNCVAGFPPLVWDVGTLLTLQRELRDQTRRAQGAGAQHSCQPCGVYFEGDAEAERHKGIWHSSREVWLCPTTDDAKSGPLASYFSPTDQPAERADIATCPYCSVLFADLAMLYPTLSDWDARVEHLEVDHNLNRCQPVCKFPRSGDVLLHLTNIHNISLSDYTKEVINSCRREESPLARTADYLSPAAIVKPDESEDAN
ncbi:MAG: hypothetical protein M1839_004203 [Geoglossum umbratile]|nr:MAG: hypothetical protein M1839_004203 [Geoglossum umbratile]